MNKKQLRTLLTLLEKASNVQKKKRKDYIKKCSDDEIHAICGATKNLVDGNFDLSKGRKAYLKKKLIHLSVSRMLTPQVIWEALFESLKII